jgi:hypothetical protein
VRRGPRPYTPAMPQRVLRSWFYNVCGCVFFLGGGGFLIGLALVTYGVFWPRVVLFVLGAAMAPFGVLSLFRGVFATEEGLVIRNFFFHVDRIPWDSAMTAKSTSSTVETVRGNWTWHMPLLRFRREDGSIGELRVQALRGQTTLADRQTAALNDLIRGHRRRSASGKG